MLLTISSPLVTLGRFTRFDLCLGRQSKRISRPVSDPFGRPEGRRAD